MDHSDPVPDGKKCSTCGRLLIYFGHGANTIGRDERLREGLFRCPDDHELWSYAPASEEWTLMKSGS
jgi:hypothetical protein